MINAVTMAAISPNPAQRVEIFAGWLRAYMDQTHERITLNSLSHPEMMAAAKKYDSDLAHHKVVDTTKFLTAQLNFSNKLISAHQKANAIGDFPQYDNAISAFKNALLNPHDIQLRHIAKEKFLEAKKNEKTTTEDSGNKQMWQQLEAELIQLQQDDSYINQEQRTIAHINLINTVCRDTVTMDLITHPFILRKPQNDMPQKVYQYFPSYQQAPYHWEISTKNADDSYTDEHIRFLPELEKEMNAFYRNFAEDTKNNPPKAGTPIRQLSEDIDIILAPDDSGENFQSNSIPQHQANNGNPPGIINPQNREAPDWLIHVFYFLFSSAFASALGGLTLGLDTYRKIDGFHKTEVNMTSEEYEVPTTEGAAYISLLAFGMLFTLLSLLYASHFLKNPITRQPLRSELSLKPIFFKSYAGFFGLIAGVHGALFTAKYFDGLTKPEYDNSGKQNDYNFTDAGDWYIAGMGFLVATLLIVAVTKMLQFQQNNAVNRPVGFVNQGLGAGGINNEHRPLLAVQQ